MRCAMSQHHTGTERNVLYLLSTQINISMSGHVIAFNCVCVDSLQLPSTGQCDIKYWILQCKPMTPKSTIDNERQNTIENETLFF